MIANRIVFALIAVGFALVSIGCSSGGDSTYTTPPAIVDSDATGVWKGAITEDGVGTFELTGIVEGNQVRLISISGDVLYAGSISITGTSFTAETTNYHINSLVLFGTSNLVGTVETKSKLSGTFTSSTGGTGSFSLIYDSVTDKGSSLAITDGNWTIPSEIGTSVISIDSTGLVTGTDVNGCVWVGTVSIIDPLVNIYALSLDASSCPVDGAYTGYAFISDTVSTNDTVFTIVNSPYIALTGEWTRT